MDGIIDVASAQRIVMNVLDLLPHNLFRLDRLRMTSFLPQLAGLIDLVLKLVELQFLKQRPELSLLHLSDDRGSREGLELADAFTELRAHSDPVQMVFHDHKGENINFPLRLKESPTVEDMFDKAWMREDRQPGHNSCGHEMGGNGLHRIDNASVS